MDGPRFDAWTRRRFGLAAGAAIASILGPAAADDSVADRRRHVRVDRCRKLSARCSPKKGSKYRCCDKIHRLHCDRSGYFAGSFHCCYDYQQVCSGAPGECCRDLTCGSVPALSGSRCCAKPGSACTNGNDCCAGGACAGGFCFNNDPIYIPPCVAFGLACPTGCTAGMDCLGCCTGVCAGNGTCGTPV